MVFFGGYPLKILKCFMVNGSVTMEEEEEDNLLWFCTWEQQGTDTLHATCSCSFMDGSFTHIILKRHKRQKMKHLIQKPFFLICTLSVYCIKWSKNNKKKSNKNGTWTGLQFTFRPSLLSSTATGWSRGEKKP